MSYEQRIDNPDQNPDSRSWDLDAELQALHPNDVHAPPEYMGGLALRDNPAIVVSVN